MCASPDSFDYHLATPAGEAAVAIVEVYGAAAGQVLQRLLRPRRGVLPEPGRAGLCEIRDGDVVIDEAIVQQLPAGGLWSGLPGWVLTLHGGIWIRDRVEALLAREGGVRRTTAGILDLAVATGALDAVRAAAFELLLEASTEAAAAYFARQHAGGLSSELERGLQLIDRGELAAAQSLLRQLLAAARQAYRLGHPLRILLTGRPNAGKSTLFNRWAGRELAAVTALPGTTRDVLETRLEIEGYPVLLLDGAGLRPLDEAGEVERQGIIQARTRSTDVVLCLVPYPWSLTALDEEIVAGAGRDRCLYVASQADLGAAPRPSWADHAISALRGDGVDELLALIRRRWIDAELRPAWDVPVAAFTARQVELLRRGEAARGLDELREAYIECLRRSWPVTPQDA